MKKLLCFAFVSGLVATASAQTNIDWFSIDAGGGAASSANYLINGTIGQADAGILTSANYSIIGGFWAVQNLGPATALPELHIATAPAATVLLWWPSPSTGFVLQENTDLSNPAGWVDVNGVVTDNGFTKSITRPVVGVSRFYRLRHP